MVKRNALRPLNVESLEHRKMLHGGEEHDGDPPLSAFAISDVNPNSPRWGQGVSPRDYLEQVSGWYFTHST